ncbi:hypothetical protein ACWEKM_07550 [Streptomyces sp. NPDC004752]
MSAVPSPFICSASDAHGKVIEAVLFSMDMGQCNSNSLTRYTFSYECAVNEVAVNHIVYCLVGLGSYAR